MSWSQLLPKAVRSGSYDTGVVPWVVGQGYTRATLRLDVRNASGDIWKNYGNPFNAPSLQVFVFVDLSYDGGQTWQRQVASTFSGSAAGTWGKGQTYPSVAVALDEGSPEPTHVRAGYAVGFGQVVTFGVSAELR